MESICRRNLDETIRGLVGESDLSCSESISITISKFQMLIEMRESICYSGIVRHTTHGCREGCWLERRTIRAKASHWKHSTNSTFCYKATIQNEWRNIIGYMVTIVCLTSIWIRDLENIVGCKGKIRKHSGTNMGNIIEKREWISHCPIPSARFIARWICNFECCLMIGNSSIGRSRETCWEEWEYDTIETHIPEIRTHFSWECSCCSEIFDSTIKSDITDRLTPCIPWEWTIGWKWGKGLSSTIEASDICSRIKKDPSSTWEIECSGKGSCSCIDLGWWNRRSRIKKCLSHIKVYICIRSGEEDTTRRSKAQKTRSREWYPWEREKQYDEEKSKKKTHNYELSYFLWGKYSWRNTLPYKILSHKYTTISPEFMRLSARISRNIDSSITKYI